MPIEFFGFSIGKKKSAKSGITGRNKTPETFVQPTIEDGSTVVDNTAGAGGFFGSYVDFDRAVKSEIEFVNRYREMALHPEVEGAIEDVCNEAIVYDDIKNSVELNLDRVDSLSDNIKNKMQDEFEDIYGLFNFENKGYEIFRRWYIDGKIYYHMVVDSKSPNKGVQELAYIDPTQIKKIVEVNKKTKEGVEVVESTEEYYIYREKQESNTGIRIASEAVCYVTSGLYDASSKKIISYLHKAIKPLNQLRMIEDAVVIYRISRAPERRIFYIDVGSLPKTKAEQYVNTIMNKYRNKLVYNADDGSIRDDKKHMSMLEDYWLPRREGGKGTEISTLDGGQNLGEMDDVEYFQKRLFQSLSIPRTRFEMDSGFSVGRSSEINRDEVKFMKFISRLRNKFNELFRTVLKTQCLLKGIMTEDEWNKIDQHIKFDYAQDNHFTELKDYEILGERMTVLRDVNDYIGKYYSTEWVRKNILRQDDEDIKEIDKQVAQEREAGIITDDNGNY